MLYVCVRTTIALEGPQNSTPEPNGWYQVMEAHQCVTRNTAMYAYSEYKIDWVVVVGRVEETDTEFGPSMMFQVSAMNTSVSSSLSPFRFRPLQKRCDSFSHRSWSDSSASRFIALACA
eukprot:Sspe_Gene.51555::Locus_28622_Transcript_2_4_Confidence_0.444_Length_995::g.51555::m.51555